jgi:hypothetical protein
VSEIVAAHLGSVPTSHPDPLYPRTLNIQISFQRLVAERFPLSLHSPNPCHLPKILYIPSNRESSFKALGIQIYRRLSPTGFLSCGQPSTFISATKSFGIFGHPSDCLASTTYSSDTEHPTPARPAHITESLENPNLDPSLIQYFLPGESRC